MWNFANNPKFTGIITQTPARADCDCTQRYFSESTTFTVHCGICTCLQFISSSNSGCWFWTLESSRVTEGLSLCVLPWPIWSAYILELTALKFKNGYGDWTIQTLPALHHYVFYTTIHIHSVCGCKHVKLESYGIVPWFTAGLKCTKWGYKDIHCTKWQQHVNNYGFNGN